MTEEVAGVDVAGMDNDGGKVQEVDNDGRVRVRTCED